MHKIVNLILLFLLLVSCATIPPAQEAVCRHVATMCALVYQENHKDVRITFGPTLGIDKKPSEFFWHAQAKVLIDGKWEWIQFDSKYSDCYVGVKEGFLDLNDYTIDMFIRWQLLQIGNRRFRNGEPEN